MPKFFPIIFVHGWGGPSDLVRDFGASDESDPYVGWNTGHRYNDPDGWVKSRDMERNFEGLVLRLVKDFNYYDTSNDEELARFKTFLGLAPPPSGEALPPGPREAAPNKTLWVFRYYEYNEEYLRLTSDIKQLLANELHNRNCPAEYTDQDHLVGIPYYAALLALKIEQIACPQCHSLEDGKIIDGLGLKQVALVCHSMGGLISRFALQYNLFGVADNVARLMTMSTPHGGARYAATARFLRFLPALREDDIQFFTPQWITDYLGGQTPKFEGQTPKEKLPLEHTDVFCLIGTRHKDYYPIARQLPRTDGVVDQREAFLNEYPYAYVYNTHSGEHGIRENHDAYQALRRFLFGDLYVRLLITDIDLKPGQNLNSEAAYYFHYFVKPRGINTQLNEISERSENQPRPRTLTELKLYLKDKPYVIYDGFADSGALVDKSARMGFGVAENEQDLPHLQLEYGAFKSDLFVGGQSVGSGCVMIPLIEGTNLISFEDQTFTATLQVEVQKRA
jgi:PGAP1-like protein